MRLPIVAVVIGVAASSALASSQGPPRLSPLMAAQHTGEVATVCGTVVQFRCDPPDWTTRLELEAPGGILFNIAIPFTERPTFGMRVEDRYYRRQVCVTGRIDTARTGYSVAATSPDQLRIEAEPAVSPLSPALGAYRPCDEGVALPKVIHESGARYTPDAMRAKIRGRVILQGVVTLDGSVTDIKVLRSLDPAGLDDETVKAFSQWRFSPGTRHGEPVPVIVTWEMVFTLRP